MDPNKRPRNDSKDEKEECDNAKRQRRAALKTVDEWGLYLPTLVAQKIFAFIVNSEEGVPALSTLSCVNWCWYDLTKELSLVQKFRVPVKMMRRNDQRIIQLVDSWNFAQVREVDVSGWSLLTDLGLQALVEACPQLLSVNLSGTCVTSVGIQLLADMCPALIDINLSAIKTDACYGSGLQHLLSHQGKQLRSLSLAKNSLRNFSSVLNMITVNCVELRCLDLSDAEFAADPMQLDICRMQAIWRKLEILRLGNSPFDFVNSGQFSSDGFTELQEVSLGCRQVQLENALHVTDNILNRLLKASNKLKKLNVSGCRSLTAQGLDSIPVTDLECLSVANCPVVSLEGISIILTKWIHSLRELDMSSNVFPGMMLDIILKKRNPNADISQLRILSLKATQITLSSVRSLMEELPHLTSVRLNGCRGLPRSMQKEFEGGEVARFRHDVAAVMLADTDGVPRVI